MKSFRKFSSTRKVFQIALLSSLLSVSSFITASAILTTATSALSVAQQGNNAVTTPRNGQDKVRVEADYGSPLERISSVGEPPISKWVYQEFTVYFEYDLVLHAVLHK